MLLTNELIEQYKKDPYKFSYDSGYNCASIDAWNEDIPKSFKKTDTKAYREGYRHGWAAQRAYLRAETIDCSIHISERRFNELKKIELDYVTAKTNELAECPDEECEEYDNNWLEVIDLLERQNSVSTEGVVKRVTKNGVVYERDKL